MKVLEFPLRHDYHDIAKVLRNIADDVENGKLDFAPTMGVLVLGAESSRPDIAGPVLSFDWQTHGLGDCGFFATKGLLGCALSSFDRSDG